MRTECAPGRELVVYVPPPKMGRPTTYTQARADRICELIACSNRGLAYLLAQDEELPSESTVFRWLEARPAFREQYARARERQADLLVDECVVISDDTSEDTIYGERGAYPNTEWIARSKLRVETRKWAASKLAPKKYGDKLEIDAKVDQASTLTVTVDRPPPETREEWLERRARELAAPVDAGP